MTPHGDVNGTPTPRALDYTRNTSWIALPSTKDEADVALDDMPAIDQTRAAVDVFYVHSTSSIAPVWNAAADDPAIRAASVRGGTLIQASVFNACCAVYAPEYRQATGIAFVTPSTEGGRAVDIAYADVDAAFSEFLRRSEHPFIVAGHSQGSILLARLMRERIACASPACMELAHRLVAAYLIGAPLSAHDVAPLHACRSRDEIGCIITFNARGPGHTKNATEFGARVPEGARLCVNPTLGLASNEAVPAAKHGGAVFFDADSPALLPQFVASRCSRGRLVVTEMKSLPKRDALSGVLLWVMGGENDHPIEYQLFYADLRADALRRASLRIQAAKE